MVTVDTLPASLLSASIHQLPNRRARTRSQRREGARSPAPVRILPGRHDKFNICMRTYVRAHYAHTRVRNEFNNCFVCASGSMPVET
jgi:hypothetical protein